MYASAVDIDPLGRPTIMAGGDHYIYFHNCCPYVGACICVHFSKSSKTKQIFTAGLAEWIIVLITVVRTDEQY